ncbi:unnamed protein product [Acanthoscelides obtectus]|uniref:Uncharacterized protein n=1 Tax=Acanthoscelides obtectus TaxID=200917 RepID=A0A9P0LQK5_ACAOB|nr:unnamed protein product [Acanthoscelides obtectus]CAK1657285.1 hypothetical protein AOBTE_LOCUS20271 [Acanthoscelides obtectus]
MSHVRNIKEMVIYGLCEGHRKLKNKMPSGVDTIPSFIVEDCIHALARPLSVIFNLMDFTVDFKDGNRKFVNGGSSLVAAFFCCCHRKLFL